MKADYTDIKSRIDAEPVWYDENGVPRYDEFHPDLSPNIYAREVLLVEIACQSCGIHFAVEMNWDGLRFGPSLFECIFKWQKRTGERWCPIHYGDPPRHDCVGDTMNCDDLRVLQFWARPAATEWVRMHGMEVTFEA